MGGKSLARDDLKNCMGKIVRYRVGHTALFRVDKIDDLNGYKVFYGLHCCGDEFLA